MKPDYRGVEAVLDGAASGSGRLVVIIGESPQMIDMSMTGIRCRATQELRTHQGVVKRSTEGTIRHHIDNFGRQLISVQWDNGVTAYVFPFEIEIIDDEDPFGSAA